MGRPYIDFKEVKRVISIPDVLESFGLLDRFIRRGETLTGVCPLPQHQHGPSPNPEQFKINQKDGVWLWHCFGDCQRGGDVIEFTKAMTGHSDAHVRLWFAEAFSDKLNLSKSRPSGEQGRQASKSDTIVAPNQSASSKEGFEAGNPDDTSSTAVEPLKPLGFRLQLDPDAPYLRERGVMPETIHRYGLGLAKRGMMAGYVAIPIYRYPREGGENPVAYLGRWPGDDYNEEQGKPRYKFPPDFPASRIVYGLNQALQTQDDQPLIVVEGPFKVFHLVQCGFVSTVAILGSFLSNEQARQLIITARPIVLLFDGDKAGSDGAERAVDKLISRTFVKVVSLTNGTEPDNLTVDDLMQKLL